jgi:hypothetical protein
MHGAEIHVTSPLLPRLQLEILPISKSHEQDLGNFPEVDRRVLISTCLLSTAAFHRVGSKVDWADRSEYARALYKVT